MPTPSSFFSPPLIPEDDGTVGGELTNNLSKLSPRRSKGLA